MERRAEHLLAEMGFNRSIRSSMVSKANSRRTIPPLASALSTAGRTPVCRRRIGWIGRRFTGSTN